MMWLTHTPGKGTGSTQDAEQHFNTQSSVRLQVSAHKLKLYIYEGWNFNSGNYLFTTGTK